LEKHFKHGIDRFDSKNRNKKTTNWFYESDGSYPTTSWFEKGWKIMDKNKHGKEKKRPTKSG